MSEKASPHSLTGCQQHIIPLICWSWHQLQFVLSGEMCQVNHWKQTASGQLQINQQHPGLSHQSAVLRGKEKSPVTDPLARCWSRGNFSIPTFTSSISGRPSISATNKCCYNIYHCNTFQRTNPCHTDLWRSDRWWWISLAATLISKGMLMRGYTMRQGPPFSLLHNLLTFSKLGSHKSVISP